MRIFIDDGSTAIKLMWFEDKELKSHISPNSFRRGWSPALHEGTGFNYTANNSKFTFNPVAPDVLRTNNVDWQYSPANAVAIQHALQTSGIRPQELEIVVTLPVTEMYDHNAQLKTDNIEKKKSSVMQLVEVNRGESFTLSKVTVRPESIPAGLVAFPQGTNDDTLLIVDIGGTTLDMSLVAGDMSNILAISGDNTVGATLVTNATIRAMSIANTEVSTLLAEKLVANRDSLEFIEHRLNDPDHGEIVQRAIYDAQGELSAQVTDAISHFKGYTHIVVVGGGAPLVIDAVREKCGLRKDRCIVAPDPQLALVKGLTVLG